MSAASPPLPPLEPLIISAPFGNYIHPAGTTPTLGTFTLERRRGRVRRTLGTVRYHRRLGAWVNRIGLRNPGMEWLVERVRAGRIEAHDKIVSIHGFRDDEWPALLDQVEAIHPLAVELNMSCPNVGEVDWPNDLFAEALATGVPVMVKIPPVHYRTMVDHARAAGVRAFHCCNTLPVPGGGMSGKPLMPLSLESLRTLRHARPGGDDLLIVGGGGITTPADIDQYIQAGADRVAIGTRLISPRLLVSDQPLRSLIDHARENCSPCRQ